MERFTPGKLALVTAGIVFLLSLLLFWLAPGLTELFWLAVEGNGPLLPCLLLALLAGFLCWNHAICHMLDNKLRELEEKLNNTKKD